jgi:hypothetical protein
MKQPLPYIIIFFLIIINSNWVFGEKPKQWYQGTVVFHSGDTLKCKLRFTRMVSEGLLQVLDEDHVEVLTVKDVKTFSYFDSKQSKVRTFFTLPLMPELSTRAHEVFIEHLYSTHNFSILNYKCLGYPEKLAAMPFRKKKVLNKQYLFDNNTGEILPMSKQNILLLMQDKKTNVVTYLNSNHIKLKSVSEFIQLLDYHQSLSQL